jgi:hypothetical protein
MIKTWLTNDKYIEQIKWMNNLNKDGKKEN